MPRLPRFPPWKRDPEIEKMLAETRRLRAEYHEKHPTPGPPMDWAETIFFIIPAGILLAPIIAAGVFKEEVIDPRMRSKEEIAGSLKYWREFKSGGWR